MKMRGIDVLKTRRDDDVGKSCFGGNDVGDVDVRKKSVAGRGAERRRHLVVVDRLFSAVRQFVARGHVGGGGRNVYAALQGSVESTQRRRPFFDETVKRRKRRGRGRSTQLLRRGRR